jgi:hypothetical protein
MANVNITKKTRDELAAHAVVLRRRGERSGLVTTIEKLVDAVDKAKPTKASK